MSAISVSQSAVVSQTNTRNPVMILTVITTVALLLRLVLLPQIQHPGIADPNHYYNLGLQLVQGQGFTIDYIWHFYNPPQAVVHPDDFWQPGAGVIAAVGMTLFGQTVQGALLPFVILGALLPLVAYWAARAFGCTPAMCLFVAGAAAVLPEFVLSSLRTDTLIPNALLVCCALLLLGNGLRSGQWWAFAGSGVCAGLSYLMRGDNLLLIPLLLCLLVIYSLWVRGDGKTARRWIGGGLAFSIALLIVLPWLLRNIADFGSATTPNLSRMFFMTDFRDHYAYGRELTLQTWLAAQTPIEIITKRLLEMAASAKMMWVSLDLFLPVAVVGGGLLLLVARDRQRWLRIAPALVLLGGMFVFYTILAPYGSQGGSYKKSYLTLVPLLLPIAGYALEQAISNTRIRTGVALLVLLFMTANAIEFVRADIRFTNEYLRIVQEMSAAAAALPDVDGDGERIYMTQDPYMLRFVNMQSVMFPMETRDTVYDVALRYHVDYLLMPADRPALDVLVLGAESDIRFVPVLEVEGTPFIFYEVVR
ncbi:MAG: glycosyltransferase family 39 protein [Chloroflexota bacterium]|nr:glycosyltransferase family 39 protein [Chloroflexota bacterium]